MNLKNYVSAVRMDWLDAIHINFANYTPINVFLDQGLSLPCSIIRISNDTDQGLTISLDGILTHDHFWVASGQTLQIDAQLNNPVPSKIAQFPKGTVFYVKNNDILNQPTGIIYVAGYSSYRN